jgi:hypothetical protein
MFCFSHRTNPLVKIPKDRGFQIPTNTVPFVAVIRRRHLPIVAAERVLAFSGSWNNGPTTIPFPITFFLDYSILLCIVYHVCLDSFSNGKAHGGGSGCC